MNDQITVFKKFEVIGETKDAAIKESGLNLRVDATQSYRKWAEKNPTNESDVKEWMQEYLKKKKLTMPNDGAYIVLQSAVADSRERPYKVNKPKYDARTHSPEKFYVLRDAAGNEVGHKKTSSDALAAAKEYVSDFKENVKIYNEWKCKEGNALYAEVDYTPSKGSRPCKLLVFGYPVISD